jgi:hypothetical protein
MTASVLPLRRPPQWAHLTTFTTHAPRVSMSMTAAERTRRKRARHKAGLRMLRIVVDEVRMEEALRRARNFTDSDLADDEVVAAELSEVLDLWFDRWLRVGHE